MKKVIELTIPIVVALAWSVLAVATLADIGELSAAVVGPSPEKYGPPVLITPDEHPVSMRQALHVEGARPGWLG